MAKQETNFFELLLKGESIIGKTIYTDEGVPVVIQDLNYDPYVDCVYVTDGTNRHKLHMRQNYDFDLSTTVTKITPNKKRIKGKRDR